MKCEYCMQEIPEGNIHICPALQKYYADCQAGKINPIPMPWIVTKEDEEKQAQEIRMNYLKGD